MPLVISIGVHVFLTFALGGGSKDNAEQKILHKSESFMVVNMNNSSVQKNSIKGVLATENLIAQKRVNLSPSTAVDPIYKDEYPLFSIADAVQPYYFQTKELTEKPQALGGVPTHITISSTNEATPSVILRLYINENGEIDRVKIEEPIPLTETGNWLIENFNKAKFIPGKLDSVPVKSQLRIEVTFSDTLGIFEPKQLLPSMNY